MCRVRSGAVIVMVAAMLLCSPPRGIRGWLCAQERDGSQQPRVVKYSQFATVKPGELTGMVLYPDGKTPAAEVAVRVWHVAKKQFIYEGTTDKKGAYKTSKLTPGRYFVIFGDRANVDLRVDKKAEMAGGPFDVIIPRGRTVFARMEPEQRSAVLAVLAETEKKEKAGEGKKEGEEQEQTKRIAGVPLKTIILVAGGVGTAVAVVEVLQDDHRREKKIVSP